MRVFKIELHQDLVTYMQRLYHEESAKERIVREIISWGNEKELDEDYFINYHRELLKSHIQYEYAKILLERMILPPKLISVHDYSWDLDFQTNVMTVRVRCECGGKLFYNSDFIECEGCEC